VCVREREREGQQEREGERELQREGMGESVSMKAARPNQSFMFPYRELDFTKVFNLSFNTNI